MFLKKNCIYFKSIKKITIDITGQQRQYNIKLKSVAKELLGKTKHVLKCLVVKLHFSKNKWPLQ